MPSSALDNIAATTLSDVPSLVSARAANSLISEDRPTRIQAETLLVLNGLLDELLLTILSSAKSLATDRIKTDGVLRVLNNNLLAKDAVLEAELELRSFVDGKRAEGARVPLGLMATSRLDGSDGFPVQAAYNALRTRCEYYSTLNECQDNNAAKDQNLMSSDGRPIATVTPGAAIYMTALLEYVGVHVLQNVSRVIERDNSDEASLYDLRAAITEDEQLNPLFNKMAIKQELARRIDVLESRRRKITDDAGGRGFRSDARVVKPWHVPAEGDFDVAAGSALFSSKRASLQPSQRSINDSATSSSRHGRAASSSMGHSDSFHGSTSTLRTSTSLANNASDGNNGFVSSSAGSNIKQNGVRPSPGLGNGAARQEAGASNAASVGRRSNSDRNWSGVFGGIKRRNSFKQGSESASASGRIVLPTGDATSPGANQFESALDPDDDFEAIMLSGQTMKVSLTPNRLHTIEVAKKGAEANVGSFRRRPGTPSVRQDATFAAPTLPRTPSSASAHSSQSPAGVDTVAASAGEHLSTSSSSAVVPSDAGMARPSSRASLQTAMRPERRTAAPPPSSYRSPSPLMMGKPNALARDVVEEDASSAAFPPPPSSSASVFRRQTPRLQPRNDEDERSPSTAKELVDLFKSTPPSATQEKFGSIASDTSSFAEAGAKKPAMGDRVRTLFGRKSSSSTGHGSPSSPRQRVFQMHQRTDTKASLEGSQDTYNTSSATNSMDQTRSLVSPNEVPFHRNTTSRSSTSTSEHPAASAEAALEAKPLPDVAVAVVEPEHTSTTKAAVGLGVGMAAVAGAAGAMGGARSPSHGSRSTSYASQTPSTVEGGAPDGSVADDASSTSKSKAQDELVSRKVPWGYKRNSTSTTAALERSSTPSSDRRRSVGYQSSNGHSVLPMRGQAGAPASDAGHGAVVGGGTSPVTVGIEEAPTNMTSGSTASRNNNAPTAWSGSSTSWAPQTLVRRGSLGSRPTSAHQSPRRGGASLETIQTLADLERAMRSCHTVDECRALVRKAMHADGASISPSTTRANGLTDENNASAGEDGNAINSTPAATSGAVVGAATAAAAVAAKSELGHHAGEAEDGRVRGLDPSTKATPTQPQAEIEITSLAKVEDGLVVAWLLGGDDDPAPTRTVALNEQFVEPEHQQRESAEEPSENHDQKVERAVHAAIKESGSKGEEEHERAKSLNSTVDADVGALASSSVVSLQSTYRDAHEEVAVE
ncbi:hypothetical protein EX895_006446 [Sporisorium graminicola]|uniref:Uncharacterized protein n=1 Tax=Sporisorium graminicola TaxID=280036 RepID=A0A4U7KKR9_9BASI|nr:hypothetical protein EX895_006446 [Sporisorium graminicola]TKY84544.1 hypothetical protein EX895_006446 [Sporisorium graminicola]